MLQRSVVVTDSSIRSRRAMTPGRPAMPGRSSVPCQSSQNSSARWSTRRRPRGVRQSSPRPVVIEVTAPDHTTIASGPARPVDSSGTGTTVVRDGRRGHRGLRWNGRVDRWRRRLRGCGPQPRRQQAVDDRRGRRPGHDRGHRRCGAEPWEGVRQSGVVDRKGKADGQAEQLQRGAGGTAGSVRQGGVVLSR